MTWYRENKVLEKNKSKDFTNTGFEESSTKKRFKTDKDAVVYQTQSDWVTARAMELAMLHELPGPKAIQKAEAEWSPVYPVDGMWAGLRATSDSSSEPRAPQR